VLERLRFPCRSFNFCIKARDFDHVAVQLDVQFSRIQLSRRRYPLSGDGRDQRDKINKPELAVELAQQRRMFSHCAGLLPGVQITVGSAVASSGSARISAAIHPGPV
jgi:hypothetical protein